MAVMNLAMFLSVLFAFIISCTKNNVDSLPKADASSVNKTLLLQLVNEVRQKGCNCGDQYYPAVSPLTWNEKLEAAATSHSVDMYNKNYFSHTSPDGSNAGKRIQRAGYVWTTYGENIAFGYNNERELIEGWLQSPTHCGNIMGRHFKEMGVGRSGTYWTQDFGSR